MSKRAQEKEKGNLVQMLHKCHPSISFIFHHSPSSSSPFRFLRLQVHSLSFFNSLPPSALKPPLPLLLNIPNVQCTLHFQSVPRIIGAFAIQMPLQKEGRCHAIWIPKKGKRERKEESFRPRPTRRQCGCEVQVWFLIILTRFFATPHAS